MARGKSINLFLMDGDAEGMIKCTLANWVGIAYRIPRTSLDVCKNRKDLKQSGVYFLFGKSDESGKDTVYVGQAGNRKNGEGLLSRLQEHRRNSKEGYWTNAVVFTTSNNSFGPTEISYLENRFCNMAKSAARYEVTNGNDPSAGNITEEKESELEDFIEYAELIMGTLGHRLFVPYTKREAEETIDNPVSREERTLFYLNRNIKTYGAVVSAIGIQTEEGFVVLKGSVISPRDNDTIPPGIKRTRERASIDAAGVLREEVLFSSPSGAAMFVIGKSANGWMEWKTKDRRTLHQVERE